MHRLSRFVFGCAALAAIASSTGCGGSSSADLESQLVPFRAQINWQSGTPAASARVTVIEGRPDGTDIVWAATRAPLGTVGTETYESRDAGIPTKHRVLVEFYSEGYAQGTKLGSVTRETTIDETGLIKDVFVADSLSD